MGDLVALLLNMSLELSILCFLVAGLFVDLIHFLCPLLHFLRTAGVARFPRSILCEQGFSESAQGADWGDLLGKSAIDLTL